MLPFLCLFLWERNLLSLSLTQKLSLNASQLTGLRFDFCLGKEMICNISSKAAPAAFVRWRTMDGIFFIFLVWLLPCLIFDSKEHPSF